MKYIEKPHDNLIKVGERSLDVTEDFCLIAKTILKNPLNINVPLLWGPLFEDLLSGKIPFVQEAIKIRGRGAEEVYYTVEMEGNKAILSFYV